ncbi:hypothetical protein INS49_006152 [Diaporthe citri]|uniref:uncharacterized protein n=1 Tax=Diaporthe citri TaxID=83186 RepID=UPI001C803A83|nr:uncharacterized protein INS49_006152 [Diaporthe citri]KAG6364550.1 hypothetical protein INS49_006152 [Diaporthe citri]
MDRILLAPEPLIRAVLVALCDSERLHARSLRYLDRLEKLNPAPTPAATTKSEAPANTQPQPTGSKLLGKRKAAEPPPPQICIQCKHAFLPDSNSPQACAFHHGNLNIDPSHRTWADAGAGQEASQQHPYQDTDDNREDRPEGFSWSCCGRGGARPGCTEGEHLAVRADDRSKRRRIADDAARSDEPRVFEGKVLRPNEFVNDNFVEEDDTSSSDDEWAWGGPVSRGVVSPVVEGGAGGDGGGDDVPSEATERDSGGGSE